MAKVIATPVEAVVGPPVEAMLHALLDQPEVLLYFRVVMSENT
ncbi:hypothetical protein [uncultured Roseobacter sp.]|nr:hypothetical protein [uncultured Roseobacter sp.]